jgi:hypothetical protein
MDKVEQIAVMAKNWWANPEFSYNELPEEDKQVFRNFAYQILTLLAEGEKPEVLSGEQRSEAIFIADCKLHGVDPEVARNNPEMLQPDGQWEDYIPEEVALSAYNNALCQAQLDSDVIWHNAHEALAVEKTKKEEQDRIL